MKPTTKPAMTQINVRFSKESKAEVKKVALSLRYSDSEIARAALNIGLNFLEEAKETMSHDEIFAIMTSNQIKYIGNHK